LLRSAGYCASRVVGCRLNALRALSAAEAEALRAISVACLSLRADLGAGEIAQRLLGPFPETAQFIRRVAGIERGWTPVGKSGERSMRRIRSLLTQAINVLRAQPIAIGK
jgi:hypothetical protein